jgi:hypothetical protein
MASEREELLQAVEAAEYDANDPQLGLLDQEERDEIHRRSAAVRQALAEFDAKKKAAEFNVTYYDVISHPQWRGAVAEVSARAIIVKADDKVGAFCAAYDYLTRKGHRVRCRYKPYDGVMGLKFTKDEWDRAVARGVPQAVGESSACAGDVSIGKIEPYGVKLDEHSVVRPLD